LFALLNSMKDLYRCWGFLIALVSSSPLKSKGAHFLIIKVFHSGLLAKPSQACVVMGVRAFVQPKISRYQFGLWDRIVTKINPDNDYFQSKHILSAGFSYSDSERLT
jgi:hypothetical protein